MKLLFFQVPKSGMAFHVDPASFCAKMGFVATHRMNSCLTDPSSQRSSKTQQPAHVMLWRPFSSSCIDGRGAE